MIGSLLIWLSVAALGVAFFVAVAMLVNIDVREHLVAFYTPFIYDSVVSCKTSEAVADELLTPSLLKKLEGKVAIVTGCTLGGIGAQTVR